MIVHHENVDRLVYETARVVEEVYPRSGTFVVAHRRLIYTKGDQGQKDNEACHIREIEKMTVCTNKEILNEYGVAPDADSSPDEYKKVSSQHATGSVHRPVYPENDREAFDK